MKLKIDKQKFMKCWNLAARCAGTANMTNSIFGSVLLVAEYDNVELRATDIRTSIVCKGDGVEVLEPGAAAFPVHRVSDLFDKAQGDFVVDVTDGKAVLTAGKSRSRFSTFPVDQFPKLPLSDAARLFCSVKAGDLCLALGKGTLCADVKANYPPYLSSACFDLSEKGLSIVTTDKRRLAICRIDTDSAGDPDLLLLPMAGVRELHKVLGSVANDADVRIVRDDSQVYFLTDDFEHAIRLSDGKMPNYERILVGDVISSIDVDKESIVSAMERVNVVVYDFNRVGCLKQSAGENMLLFGRAAEFGESVEHVPSLLEGKEVFTAFNSRFFLEAVKAVDGKVVNLVLQDKTPGIIISAKDSDSFRYLVALVEVDRDAQELIDSLELIAEA